MISVVGVMSAYDMLQGRQRAKQVLIDALIFRDLFSLVNLSFN